MACTIGAKIFTSGREFVLFKNKDMPRERFDDRLVYSPRIFGPEGVESWTKDETNQEVFSGISIGVNSSGLCCCDANIRTTRRAANYDILTQRILESASTVDEGVNVVRIETKKKKYMWANILLTDGKDVAALEVSDQMVVERHTTQLVRTNHFVNTKGCRIDYSQNCGTKTRFKDAVSKIPPASGLANIFDLLRTHRSRVLSTSICNHGKISTVYSYVIHVSGDKITFYVRQGRPCEGAYIRLPVRFPPQPGCVEKILTSYPSRRAHSLMTST